MYVTQHAAAQFVERIMPGWSREQARAHLIVAVCSAESTGERTEIGHPIWRIRDPDALLVGKHDPRYGHIVVTVLAPDMPGPRAVSLAEAEDEIVAAARRAGAGFPSGGENVDGRTARARKRARRGKR